MLDRRETRIGGALMASREQVKVWVTSHMWPVMLGLMIIVGVLLLIAAF